MGQSLDKGLGQSSCLFWSSFQEVTPDRTPATCARLLSVPLAPAVFGLILGKALPFVPDVFSKMGRAEPAASAARCSNQSGNYAQRLHPLGERGARCGRGRYRWVSGKLKLRK